MNLPTNAPLLSWQGAILALLLAVLLCWPMFIAGGIYTFADTRSYLKGGELIWQFAEDFIHHIDPEMSLAPREAASAPSVAASIEAAGSGDDRGPIVVVRSIAYSFFSYTLYKLGGPTGLAVSQGALVVFSIFAFLGPIQSYRMPVLLSGTLVLGLLTTLPWFVVFMMPDILTAIVLLHGALLMRRFDELTRTQQVLMTSLAAFATASHYGNPPLAFGIYSAVLAWRYVARRWSKQALIGALIPVLLGPFANLTISAVTLDSPSTAPLRLPILLARSLEDGPARWYLDEACPDADFAICELFETDPPEDVGEFLWSEKGLEGASRETVARIRDEELSVLLRAFVAYPVEQTVSLSRNAALQLVRFRLGGFQLVEGLDSDFRRIDRTQDTHDRAVRRVAGWLVVAVTSASGALFLFGLVFDRARREEIEIVAILLLGLLLNAIIFGGLSYPVDRYQARVIWLLPAFAVLFLAHRRSAPGL